LLLKTELTTEQKQYIDAVKTSGRNLIVIINDILDFSKIESGKITFEQTEFDLRHLISTLTELMLPKSMEKNIKISTKIDKRIHNQLIGDPTRLNQIFSNLVDNAIKFTEKGGVKITADFVSEDSDNIELKFSVTDTGIGIPKDKLNYIFEGFTQATNDTNRKYGGTGLGLTIVKQLVELQGGEISVNSKIGSGTSFIFNLKFKKTLPAEALKNNSSGKKAELSHIEKLNILLVEDNLLNQILAKKVLTNWKWNVDVADNGLIAVQKVKNASYDIVLMDIQMPEMDGYEATRQIRKKTNPSKRNIPIIAITAHAISGEAEKCYNAGMNDYITKPFDEKVLYEKIITVCKKNKCLTP
jgi:CheY-like chemotaxis protein